MLKPFPAGFLFLVFVPFNINVQHKIMFINNEPPYNYLKYLLIAGIFIAIIIFLLLIINWILQTKVRNRTKDLQEQLDTNSQIIIELEEQKNKAEESDIMKLDFITNISSKIDRYSDIFSTDLLESPGISLETYKVLMRFILENNNKTVDKINNFIYVSKLESGLEKVHIVDINIQSIITRLLDYFTPVATSKGLKLTIEENLADNPPFFFTDAGMLEYILTNLVVNAIKFTNKGSVEITYSVNDSVAEFWVADTGIGIPEEKKDSIFEKLSKADISSFWRTNGTGLGLYISKGYTDLLNGEIKIISDKKTGTTFYLRIPNNSDNRVPNISKDQIQILHKLSSKLKIIIAEDSEMNFYVLEHTLKDIAREKIIKAVDGIEAVELAKNHSDTDIILMDKRMPRLDGVEATKEIRKFNKDVTIIAMTNCALESDIAEFKEVGFDAYVTMPFTKEKLLASILKTM